MTNTNLNTFIDQVMQSYTYMTYNTNKLIRLWTTYASHYLECFMATLAPIHTLESNKMCTITLNHRPAQRNKFLYCYEREYFELCCGRFNSDVHGQNIVSATRCLGVFPQFIPM